MQETGENLIEKAFEQVTEEKSEEFEVKTGKLRMDSGRTTSNIREMSRMELLVEVLRGAHRMLGEADQSRYKEDIRSFLQGI